LYEVYLERAAERDLKRLKTEVFQRIVPYIKTLTENPGHRVVERSLDRRTTGVFALGNTGLFTKLILKHKS